MIEFDFLQLDAKRDEHIDSLFLLTKESLAKSALEDHWDKKEATNRFCLAAALLSEPVLLVVRRELKRVTPELKVSLEELRQAMTQEVLKREVTEGPKAEQARKRVARSATKALRATADGGEAGAVPEPCATTAPAPSASASKPATAPAPELPSPAPSDKPL